MAEKKTTKKTTTNKAEVVETPEAKLKEISTEVKKVQTTADKLVVKTPEQVVELSKKLKK